VELQEEEHAKGFYRHEDSPQDVIHSTPTQVQFHARRCDAIAQVHLDFLIEPKDLLNQKHSIIVPTLIGEEMVHVDIPRGSQYGDELTLYNLGFPVLYGNGAKGNQIVHLVSEHGSD
jgi:DnaJ-class molecular chaperone